MRSYRSPASDHGPSTAQTPCYRRRVVKLPMRFRRLAALVGASICGALFLVPSCSAQPTQLGCQNGLNMPGFCYCPDGDSCTHMCSTEPSCFLSCANHNVTCSVSCNDNCTAICQNSQQCNVTCGKTCLVACQGVKDRCTATVGEGADVRCESAHLCDITCTGSCHIDCPKGAACRVKCLDPSQCIVDCTTKGTAPPATTCPDNMTQVCGGAACP